ncbi:hypothetical protein C8R44DRAFT_758614 [Mycena epipterygia]|nr:hypothetical protein C8R44DRAFT_758614 [Mycena epipterygia]
MERNTDLTPSFPESAGGYSDDFVKGMQEPDLETPEKQTCLPQEIWNAVFRNSLPPSWTMSGITSLPPFPETIWSADLRTKLSIIRVCKTWHQIGLEFLYESVMLRSIGQLPAFVDALKARDGLGDYVRSIDLCCFVPHGYYKLHDSEIKKIFALCPRLSHFAFTPSFFFPGSPGTLPALASTITSLEYEANIEYSAILPSLIQLCHTLRSLSLTLPDNYNADHPTLAFDNLENLRLGLAKDSLIPAAQWMIPGLRRVLLRDHFRLAFPAYRTKQQQANAFLDAYGGTGEVLVVPYLTSGILQELLDRCPTLQHLGVPLQLFLPSNHSTLQSVDIFCPVAPHLPGLGEFDDLKAGFPALRACRYLESIFGLQHFENLPPTLPSASQYDVTAFDRIDLNHRIPDSSWLQVILSDAGSADESSDVDSDYVFNVEDDDGGSSGDTDSDSSDSDSDLDDVGAVRYYPGGEFRVNDNWEIDRDEALLIFRTTLSQTAACT